MGVVVQYHGTVETVRQFRPTVQSQGGHLFMDFPQSPNPNTDPEAERRFHAWFGWIVALMDLVMALL